MDEEATIKIAIDYLTRRGYKVTYAESFGKWFTPKEISIQYKKWPSVIHRLLRHEHCPFYETKTGESGRIILVRVNPMLHAWLSKTRANGVAIRPLTTDG